MKSINLFSAISLAGLMFLNIGSIKAQGLGYKTAVGLRLGGTEGLTVKFGIKNNAAVEGIFGFGPHSMSVTGLYEVYQPTSVSNLNWYYGGGAHIAWATNRNYYYSANRKYWYYDQSTAVGIDGIIGLEYKIPNAPIAFSLDLKPSFSIYDNGGSVAFLDPGLGIKAAF